MFEMIKEKTKNIIWLALSIVMFGTSLYSFVATDSLNSKIFSAISLTLWGIIGFYHFFVLWDS